MSKWLELDGKVVIVTGGLVGIGANITKSLKDNGAQVIVADQSIEGNCDKQNVSYIKCDVTKKSDVDIMIEKVNGKYGRIDCLINNAGVNRARLLVDYYNGESNYELSEEDFDFMVNVNQKGVFLCSQAVAKIMIKQQSGVIINISSEAGIEGSKGQSGYSMTKGAVDSLTRSWAKELGQFNVRVVGVAPGINEPTPMGNPNHVRDLAYTRGVNPKDVSKDYQKVIPLGRQGKLKEIADLVNYLVSDYSSYITGTVINITGGKSRG